MSRTSRRILFLVIPPLGFVLKDVVATMAIFATEPGITSNAARYYSIALFPGPLFVESWVMLFNFIFGVLVGLALYLSLTFKKGWLVIVPPSAFLLKDMIALALAVLSTEPEISARAASYYAIAMLPGSVFRKVVDPMFFNVLCGALMGIVLYLRAVRPKSAPVD